MQEKERRMLEIKKVIQALLRGEITKEAAAQVGKALQFSDFKKDSELVQSHKKI